MPRWRLVQEEQRTRISENRAGHSSSSQQVLQRPLKRPKLLVSSCPRRLSCWFRDLYRYTQLEHSGMFVPLSATEASEFPSLSMVTDFLRFSWQIWRWRWPSAIHMCFQANSFRNTSSGCMATTWSWNTSYLCDGAVERSVESMYVSIANDTGLVMTCTSSRSRGLLPKNFPF